MIGPSTTLRANRIAFALVALLSVLPSSACDLCAIYRATNARGESSSGFLLTISQQFIHYGTLQKEGEEYHPTPSEPPFDDAYLDTSITHIVPAYNFSEQFGVSLNMPIIYRRFHRVQYDPYPLLDSNGNFVFNTDTDETGSIFGLGDISLIGRWTPLRISKMKYSFVGSLFAGIKFPTGDTDRLEREVDRERELREAYYPGIEHLHPKGGIHQHDLTLGSGSYDGVFGGALTVRYDRWFFGAQGQYYLRTTANWYRFGDEIIASGGPGVYLLSKKAFTLALQANAIYDTMARDVVFDVKSTETGWRSWYIGPLLSLTWGDHFSANAGVDIPLKIENNGLQTVPDYRFHGGLSWRF